MDKKSIRGSFLGNASQKMLIHCSCRVCYKEKAQNVEHRNAVHLISKVCDRNHKEKAQNVEHRNLTKAKALSPKSYYKEKAQNVEHRNNLLSNSTYK